MAFIGKGLKDVSTVNITVDSMVGDGSTNTLVLSQVAIESVIDVSVYYQGVAQVPVTDYTLTGSTLTFTTIPPVGIKVVAVTKADSFKNRVNDKSVVNASFADNAITSSKIIGLDASKLTGVLPAMDGSALTNVNIPSAPLESNVTDPTITSNKTLGTVWINTTTGRMFVLTDATTDLNVWINVGTGTDNVAYIPVTESFGGIGGGTSSGYNSGGTEVTHIQKFSLTSNGSAANVGNLSIKRAKICGNSSTTHGYTSGGQSSAITFMDTIDKFSFSTHGTAGDVGNLPSHGQINPSSQTDGTASVGYATAGYSSGGVVGVKSKFSFTTDGNSVSVGNITVARFHASGQSSPYKGYISAGAPAQSNVIEEFSFASNADTFDVADLALGREYQSGHSSNTYGYVSGGYSSGDATAYTSSVEKFSFSSTVTVSSHGNLSGVRSSTAGQSSVTDGYSTGGYNGLGSNIIDKFSFVTGGTASNIGTLASEQVNSCGQQI